MKEGEGFIVEIKEYSNSSLIVKLFTKEGKFSSFLKNGKSKAQKNNQNLIFTLVSFKISKRLEEHLGLLKMEVIKCYSLNLIKSRLKLFIIISIQEVLLFLIEENNPDEELYNYVLNLIKKLETEESFFELIKNYLIFELNLLSILGFGLDFEKCSMTNEKKNLFFISPLTGKCAGFEEVKHLKERLFEVPLIYGNLESNASIKNDLLNAFKINSHFLQNVNNFKKLKTREKIYEFIENKF